MPCTTTDLLPGQNVELEPLAQNGQQFGRQQDPNAILNECRDIDKGIDVIERNLENIKMFQQRSLDDPDSSQQSATNRQLDAMSSETMTMYRSFAARIKTLKQQPESGSPKNAPQLGKVDRKLKAAINQYQNVESDYRKKLQTQMARQYRIVRPEASEAEVREAVEDTSSQQVFSQALLQSDRRGQSRQALNAVENRHAAIQKIEGQMIELAQLFQEMEALVVQQEDAVAVIEQKGEEVQENLDKGTEQIGVAIKSARARNRKKWYCLGIVGIYPRHCVQTIRRSNWPQSLLSSLLLSLLSSLKSSTIQVLLLLLLLHQRRRGRREKYSSMSMTFQSSLQASVGPLMQWSRLQKHGSMLSELPGPQGVYRGMVEKSLGADTRERILLYSAFALGTLLACMTGVCCRTMPLCRGFFLMLLIVLIPARFPLLSGPYFLAEKALDTGTVFGQITWIQRAHGCLPTLSLLKRNLVHIESNMGFFEYNLCGPSFIIKLRISRLFWRDIVACPYLEATTTSNAQRLLLQGNYVLRSSKCYSINWSSLMAVPATIL